MKPANLIPLIILGITSTVWASEPSEGSVSNKVDDESVSSGASGMKIFIDPDTGKIRPPTSQERTSGEFGHTNGRFQPDSIDEQRPIVNGVVHHPDGSVSMPARRMHQLKVHVHEDGSRVYNCNQIHEDAR